MIPRSFIRASAFVTAPPVILAANDFTTRADIQGLQRGIDAVSRLRYTLAHENAHLVILDGHGSNRTRSMAFMETLQLFQAAWRAADGSLDVPQADAAPARTVRLLQGQNTGHGFGRLPGPFVLLAFRKDAFPPDNRAALLRLLDGILAAMCLVLVLVLAALTRHLDVLTFVLIMLAACLRYGRREEPDDYASLPICRYQKSSGSCPRV